MMKLTLCSYHSQIHGLMRVRATGVEPPMTPIVFGLYFSLSVEPGLFLLSLPRPRALPIVWQSPGGWLIMGTNLDYEN